MNFFPPVFVVHITTRMRLATLKELTSKTFVVPPHEESLRAPGTIRVPFSPSKDVCTYVEPPLPATLVPFLESDRFERWMDCEIKSLQWLIARDFTKHNMTKGSISISTYHGHTKEEQRISDGVAAKKLAEWINGNEGYKAECTLDYGKYWSVSYTLPAA